MTRNLYRIYLYVVSLVLLVFAAVGTTMLLSALLAQTALAGVYAAAPTRDQIVQSAVLAVVSWFIAGALGGLHYWLIRRDMRSDPNAGSGAIRAFFLNFAEALAAVIAMAAGVSALSGLGSSYSSQFDASGSVAIAIVALAVFAVIELERRRTRAAPGLATTFQRLHLYGIPLVFLVFFALNAWQTAVSETVSTILYNAGQYAACSATPPFGPPPFPSGVCYTASQLLPLWGAVLLVTAGWTGYALASRGDVRSALRQVFHLIGFGFGAIMVAVGIERALELAFRAMLALPVYWTDLVTSYNFLAPLIFGVVITLAYGAWLRAEARGLPMGAATTGLVVEAISAGILAVPFWWGLASILRNAIESMVASGSPPTQSDWAMAYALVVTGIAYPVLALDLRRRSIQTADTGPRRAFVFALLAGGAVTGAVGAVVALYAVGANLLNAPLTDWQQTARTGAVAFVVGAVIAGIYVWQARREHFFEAAPKKPELPPSAPPALDSIESVLDTYAAGGLKRDDAARRIHDLEQRHPATV